MLAFMKCSMQLLVTALGLPEDTIITSIKIDYTYPNAPTIDMIVSHKDIDTDYVDPVLRSQYADCGHLVRTEFMGWTTKQALAKGRCEKESE